MTSTWTADRFPDLTGKVIVREEAEEPTGVSFGKLS